MVLGIPLFLIFGVYGVVNAYLPVMLSGLGYSVTEIGVLQGMFEAAGMAFPILVNARVDRRGNYVTVITLLALLMIVVLPPLVAFRSFWVTGLLLALLAVGFKGTVPLVDTLVSRSLGGNATDYGKVRVLGSIGFVCVTLLLQFTSVVDSTSASSIAVAIAVPCALFAASVPLVPRLFARISLARARRSGAGTPVAGADPQPKADRGDSSTAVSIGSPRAFVAAFPKSYWAGIALVFLGFFGMTPSQRFFSLYVRDYLGLESYAGLWALSAAAEVPFMFLSGRFIRKYGTKGILVFSLAAIGARNLVYAAIPTFGGAVIGQLFHSVCFGLFHPAAVVFIGERAPKRLLALALTMYSSVSVGIASVLGNVAGGFVIDRFGYRVLFVVFAAFPLAGVLALPAFSKRR